MAERWSIWGSLLAVAALCAGCDGRVEQSERLNWALSQPALVAVLSPYPPGTHFNRAIEDGLRRCHVNAQAIDAIPTGTDYPDIGKVPTNMSPNVVIAFRKVKPDARKHSWTDMGRMEADLTSRVNYYSVTVRELPSQRQLWDGDFWIRQYDRKSSFSLGRTNDDGVALARMTIERLVDDEVLYECDRR